MAEGFKYIERKIVSKAQKRRNAKEEKRKEQLKRIEQEEEKDEHKDRRIEQDKFQNLLAKIGLRIFNIDADGDCLYKAIEHQLSLSPDSDERLSFQDIRDRTSEYMLSHSDDFLPFLSNDQGDLMSQTEYINYCTRISKTKEWGGHIELTAITQFTKKAVHIYQADHREPIIIEPAIKTEKKPMLISFHKHLYHLGAHYNSLIEDVDD